jgi:hypothetical protein
MGFEEGALADAAHAGEDLDQWLEGVGFELLEIKISAMHEEMLISKKFSIVNLFLRFAERADPSGVAGKLHGARGPLESRVEGWGRRGRRRSGREKCLAGRKRSRATAVGNWGRNVF